MIHPSGSGNHFLTTFSIVSLIQMRTSLRNPRGPRFINGHVNSTKMRRLGLRAEDITHTPCCAGKGVIYRQGSHAGRVLNKSKEIYVVSWPTFADGHNESQAEPAHLILIFSFNFIFYFLF